MTAFWFDAPEEDLAANVSQLCKQLRTLDAPRRERYRRLLSHFENRDVGGLDAHDYALTGSLEERRKIVNLGRGIVDAVQARVGKNRPKATFLTDRGDYGTQRQAKKLEAFCVGVLDQSDFYGVRGLPLVVRDAALLGTGVFKVAEEVVGDRGQITVERTLPWTVLVDPMEAHYGRPRCIYQYHNFNRQRLAKLYPDHAEAIAKAPSAERAGADARQVDEVTVYEAWHLASYDGANDGKHVICLENVTLSAAEWSSPRSPFCFVHWTEPTAGFWGASLLEDVEVMDSQFNEILYQIVQAIWHHATPKILEPREGEIEECAWDNDVRGVRVKYSAGAAPEFVAPTPVSPDLARQVEWFRATAYQQSGVSELSATSRKPAGLDSGAALREFNDIESERFIIRGYGIEGLAVASARLTIDAARRLDADGISCAVRTVRKRRRQSFVESIRWKQVNLDDDAFVLKVFPTSALPDTPSYKIAAIQEYFQAGLLTQEQMASLLDFPDLEGTMDLSTAPYEIVLDQIEQMLDEGIAVIPEPFQRLDLCISMGRNAYLRGRIDRMEEDRLDLLRRYVTDAERMANEAQAAAAPPPQEMPAAPPEAVPAEAMAA